VGAGWVAIIGVGSVPLMVSVCTGGVVGRGVSLAWAVAGLRLPRGGVVQRWVGAPAGWSTSIGEVSVGGAAVTTAAYELGAEVLGIAVALWVAGEGSVSIRVEGDSLVHLDAEDLVVVGGGTR